VQRGVRVYKKRRTEETVDDGDVEITVGFWTALEDAVLDLPAAIVRGPSLFSDDYDSWLARVLAWPLFKPLAIMISYHGDEDEKRVDTFYPDKWVTASEYLSYSLVVIITFAFGGIHCLGWSFNFLSSIERTLWRAASLLITGFPILIVPLGVLGQRVDEIILKERFGDCCLSITFGLPLLLYVLSRLALLILPLLSLRSLPPAAFQVVHWTSIIPHV